MADEAETTTTQLVDPEAKAKQIAARQRIPTESSVAIMDTAKFDHLGRVARVMAQANLMPESITMTMAKGEDGREQKVYLPDDVITARAFLIAAQADRWGMDPLAVMSSCAVISNKLSYEGKLVYAVLQERLGISLRFEFGRWEQSILRVIVGEDPPKDQPELLGIVVSGIVNGREESVEGCVGAWRTTRNGSPWANSVNWRRQLRYRGTREFANAYAPGAVLGVLSDDELEDNAALYANVIDHEPARPPAQLSDAFGKVASNGGEKIDTPPAKEETKPKNPPKASAARTAAPAKDTSASATPASTTSQDQGASGPKPPSGGSGGGTTVDEREAEIQAAAEEPETQQGAGPAQQTAGPVQQPTGDARESAAQAGPTAGEVVHALHTGQDVTTDGKGNVVSLADRKPAQPAEEPSDETAKSDATEDDVDAAAFNAYADEVKASGTWVDLKGITSDFRRSAAMAAAPIRLQRQAMALAWNHAQEKGITAPEGDVEWYRLWLATEPPKDQVRPAFRKLMRAPGGEYGQLDATTKDAVVDETNEAERA